MSIRLIFRSLCCSAIVISISAFAQNTDPKAPPVLDVHVHAMDGFPGIGPMCPNTSKFTASDPKTKEESFGWVKEQCTPALYPSLQANSHVYVDVAGLIWSYPIKEVNRYIERLVEGGFEDRVMFGTDQMIWPKLMAYSISIIQNADYLTTEEKRDILYNNAARFLRLDNPQSK